MTDQQSFTSHGVLGPEWRLPAAVRILVAARVVNRLGAFTLPFLAVVLVDEFGASLAAAGLVVAAFGLATIASRLAGGALADRIGRKPTIVLGLAGCAVAQLGIATAPSFTAAAAAAVLLGLVFELYEPPTQATIADVTSPHDRPAAFGLLGASLAVAGVLAGLLAAALGSVHLRLLFVADAATCLGCAALVLVALPGRQPTGSDAVTGGVRSPWRDPRLWAMLAAGTVFATVYMAIMIGLPLSLRARGQPVWSAGVVLAASAATTVLGQRLLRLPGDGFRLMSVAYVVLAGGLALAARADDLATYVVAAVIWSLGDVVLLGHPFAVVSALADAQGRGRYLAAYGVSWGLATVLAPLAVPRLLTAGGPAALWLTCAAASLVLAVGQVPLRRICRAAPTVSAA